MYTQFNNFHSQEVGIFLGINNSKDYNATKGYYTKSAEGTFYFVNKGQDFVNALAYGKEVAFIEARDFYDGKVNYEQRNMSNGKCSYSMNEVVSIVEAAIRSIFLKDYDFMSTLLGRVEAVTYLLLQKAAQTNGSVGSLKNYIFNSIFSFKDR